MKEPRILTEHQINPANDKLVIEALDEPGAGGAHHHYRISGYTDNAGTTEARTATDIRFQNGPIAVAGVNGLTQEALIVICIDRLTSFQAGPFANPENAKALASLKEALKHLHKRTKDRVARGVEGTHAK